MEHTLSGFEPVADRVWLAVAAPESANIGLIAGDDGCLVVGTGSSPEQGRAIREAAERTAGVPVVAAAVTHGHDDAPRGLAAFADVATYAHASIAEAVGANQSFKLAAMVALGGRHVELVHFGPGRTPGDIVVLVPQARVAFAGDLIEGAGPPTFEPGTDLAGWPRALDGVLGTLRADSIVVPWRGSPVDRDVAFVKRGELAGTYLQLEYLFQSGAKPEDVYERGDWYVPREFVEAAAVPVFAELKAKGKVGRPLRVLH